jgi:hypothetical protein
LVGLSAALAAALVFGFSAIIQAVASRRVSGSDGLSTRLVVGLLSQGAFLLAVALNLVGFVLHLVAVRLLPLYLAQAGVAASLAVTALLAVRYFRDHLSATDWTAVGSVCVGLALLAAGSGEVGTVTASDNFLAGLFIVLAAIAVSGLIASRTKGATAAALLGLLAGCGFAGSGVSARVLPGLTPAELVVAPAAYALPLFGGLAFLLYSLALQRGTVTSATAPMIVVQTVGPAAVGLIMLDDGVRSGWVVPAAVGFVLAVAGAIALARFEDARHHI